MSRAPATRLLAAVVLLAALLGCSSEGGAAPSASGTPGPSSTSAAPSSPAPTADTTDDEAERVARIGVLTTLSGRNGSAGRGVRNAVELAVREANEEDTVPGWRFEVVAVDDGGNQSAGQRVASRLAGTGGIVGVVGSLHSAIDEGVQPIFNDAGIAMLGPGATADQLTRRSSGGSDVRPFPTYFRLAPRRADQGAAAARWTVRRSGAERVAVVDDGSAYGRAMTRGYVRALRGTGVEVVRRRSVEVSDRGDLEGALALRRAAASVARADERRGVDLVVVGGDRDVAALLADALRARDVTAPLLGGDALLDDSFVGPGGAARPGDLALFPGVPDRAVPSGRAFRARYDAAGFTDGPGAHGAAAYDAARAVVTAFGAAVGERDLVNGAVRRDVVAALDELDLDGVTGPVSFDAFGDRERARYTVYRVELFTWRPVAPVAVGSRR